MKGSYMSFLTPQNAAVESPYEALFSFTVSPRKLAVKDSKWQTATEKACQELLLCTENLTTANAGERVVEVFNQLTDFLASKMEWKAADELEELLGHLRAGGVYGPLSVEVEEPVVEAAPVKVKRKVTPRERLNKPLGESIRELADDTSNRLLAVLAVIIGFPWGFIALACSIKAGRASWPVSEKWTLRARNFAWGAMGLQVLLFIIAAMLVR